VVKREDRGKKLHISWSGRLILTDIMNQIFKNTLSIRNVCLPEEDKQFF